MTISDDIVREFNPIHLDELGGLKLMDRVDDKYLFNIALLPAILNKANHDYRVLEIENHRLLGYDNLYYDTVDHFMYRQHHNRKLNRYKVRIRQYLDSNQFFLEVKFKNNKNRVKKQRIGVKGFDTHTEEESRDFITANSPFSVDQLEPKLYTSFERITLVNTVQKERITLDFNLTLKNKDKTFTIPYLVIAEVKHEPGVTSRGFGKLLLEERIFPRRISKYCLGTNLLYPDVKYNRFKPKILFLNKLDRTKQYDELFSAII